MTQHIRFTHIGEPTNLVASVNIPGGSIVAAEAAGTAKVAGAVTDTYFGYSEKDVKAGDKVAPIYDCEVEVKAVGAIPALSKITMAAGGGVAVAGNTDKVIGLVRKAIADGAWGRAYVATPV